MRDLLLSLIIPAGLIWGVTFRARIEIIVLNWIWFQRPYDFSYGLWNSAPLFTLALGVAILSNILRGQFRPEISADPNRLHLPAAVDHAKRDIRV
ncbi:MAG: hypothetical protein R3F53_13370 [Gammaproteobacteria bacterium]